VVPAGRLPVVPAGRLPVALAAPRRRVLADRLLVRLARGLRVALAGLRLLVAPVGPPRLAAVAKAQRRRRC